MYTPLYLRNAFLHFLDSQGATGVTEEFTVEHDGEEKGLDWLLGQLWNCGDALPAACRNQLNLAAGATYADAVRFMKVKLNEGFVDPETDTDDEDDEDEDEIDRDETDRDELAACPGKVTDVERAWAVLNSFRVEGVQLSIDVDGFLQVTREDNYRGLCFPCSVRLDELPDANGFPNNERFEDACDDVMSEKGHDGFLELLNELAPLLATPFILLMVFYEGGFCAQVWYVHSASGVKTLFAE